MKTAGPGSSQRDGSRDDVVDVSFFSVVIGRRLAQQKVLPTIIRSENARLRGSAHARISTVISIGEFPKNKIGDELIFGDDEPG